MERLTDHSAYNGTPVPNRDTIGDLCLMMSFCDDYDFCEGCPVKKMMDRLCAYEDTGLTPEEIAELKEKKNTAKVRRCKDGSEHNTTLVTTKVTRNGVLIRGTFYYSPLLLFKCLNKDVDILIYEHLHLAVVFYHKELIGFFELGATTQDSKEDVAKREAFAKAIKYARESTSQTRRCQ